MKILKVVRFSSKNFNFIDFAFSNAVRNAMVPVIQDEGSPMGISVGDADKFRDIGGFSKIQPGMELFMG